MSYHSAVPAQMTIRSVIPVSAGVELWASFRMVGLPGVDTKRFESLVKPHEPEIRRRFMYFRDWVWELLSSIPELNPPKPEFAHARHP